MADDEEEKKPSIVSRAVNRARIDESQLEDFERNFEEQRRNRRFTAHITTGCISSIAFTVITLIPEAGLIIHILIAAPIVSIFLQEYVDKLFKL